MAIAKYSPRVQAVSEYWGAPEMIWNLLPVYVVCEVFVLYS